MDQLLLLNNNYQAIIIKYIIQLIKLLKYLNWHSLLILIVKVYNSVDF